MEMNFSYKNLRFPSQIEIKYLDNINEYIKTLKLSFELQKTEDIVNKIYEGGFKIWECTIDLLDFLDNNDYIDLKQKKVLDLGCGQGLLGIYALKRQAEIVVFQDFNPEVIEYCTMVNIKQNDENFLTKSNFITGDWSDFVEKLWSSKFGVEEFDYIFMSEVIYQTENYEKIADIIEKSLKKDGTCILATKFYYFGVGGSLPDFINFLERNKKSLKVVEEKEINNKKSNKRAIILIKKSYFFFFFILMNKKNEDSFSSESEKEEENISLVKDLAVFPKRSKNNHNNEYADEETFERVKKLLTCPICMSIFKDPVYIKDCSHRFCKSCIEKSIRMG